MYTSFQIRGWIPQGKLYLQAKTIEPSLRPWTLTWKHSHSCSPPASRDTGIMHSFLMTTSVSMLIIEHRTLDAGGAPRPHIVRPKLYTSHLQSYHFDIVPLFLASLRTTVPYTLSHSLRCLRSAVYLRRRIKGIFSTFQRSIVSARSLISQWLSVLSSSLDLSCPFKLAFVPSFYCAVATQT